MDTAFVVIRCIISLTQFVGLSILGVCMARVFISYSRNDLNFVQGFAQTLMSNGIDVWWDLSSLQGGDNWTDAIPQAIENSDLCIVVLTPNSIKSDWVQKEYAYALGQEKRVIPVLCQECKIPFALVNINYVDLQGVKYQNGLNQIIQLARVKPQNRKEILQPAMDANFTLNPVTFNNFPSGVFNNIWIEHNIIWGMFFGMRIHTNAGVSRQRSNLCKAVAHFFSANGQPLRDFNANPFYGTVDGFVSTAVDFIPLYEETNYPDIVVYIPYNELHLVAGIHQLAFTVSFYDVARNFYFAQSLPQPFVVTQQ